MAIEGKSAPTSRIAYLRRWFHPAYYACCHADRPSFWTRRLSNGHKWAASHSHLRTFTTQFSARIPSLPRNDRITPGCFPSGSLTGVVFAWVIRFWPANTVRSALPTWPARTTYAYAAKCARAEPHCARLHLLRASRHWQNHHCAHSGHGAELPDRDRLAERPTPEPCGVCDSCMEIRQGNAVDVIEIDAATNRGIDEIRELRDAARYSPAATATRFTSSTKRTRLPRRPSMRC